MELVIVPKSLSDEIDERIEVARITAGISGTDQEWIDSKPELSNQLVSFFHHHGYLPEFEVKKS